MLLSAEDRKRQDLGVRTQCLVSRVGAPVVVDEDLVVARVLLEHLADAPEKDADSFGFVVSGNADVQHRGSSRDSSRVRLLKVGTRVARSHLLNTREVKARSPKGHLLPPPDLESS